MMQQDRLIQNRIHRSFRRAEEQLLKALTARKGEVKVRVQQDNSRQRGLELTTQFVFECFELKLRGK